MIRTKCFQHPFIRTKQVEGSKAVFTGYLLVLIGLYSMFLIFAPFVPKDPAFYIFEILYLF